MNKRKVLLFLGFFSVCLAPASFADSGSTTVPAGATGTVGATGTAEISAAKPLANTVIQIWLWGGPSQIDTFDPKPDAGPDYTGPYATDIATDVAGIRVGQKLPLLASMADKYSIIRSMTHGVNAHETASYIMQTGHESGGLVYPSLGAVVSYFKPRETGRKLPPYVVLTETQGRFAEEGFLGPKYKPFYTGGDPAKTPFLVEGIITDGITDARQRTRHDLLHAMDTFGNAASGDPAMAAYSKAEDGAYQMILGSDRDVFDLSKESDATRDRYGRNTFGQSCLSARRLVESGVTYITINYNGWDTHKKHFSAMNQKLPEFDQGLSALISDLDTRGLLDTTIVWCGGEFGRAPKISWEAPWDGGRNHFGAAFSYLIAGGGFAGGKVVGATDAHAEKVTERPVYPKDLLSSILVRLGIDPAKTYPDGPAKGQPIMPPVSDKSGAGILKELMP